MKGLIAILVFVSVLLCASVGFAVNVNLQAQWTPNVETDMSHYVLYRTDGTRVVVAACSNVLQPTTVPLPATVTCNFAVLNVAEGAILTFVLQAVDNAGNVSLDSVTASYNVLNPPPSQPGGPGWKIILQ